MQKTGRGGGKTGRCIVKFTEILYMLYILLYHYTYNFVVDYRTVP